MNTDPDRWPEPRFPGKLARPGAPHSSRLPMIGRAPGLRNDTTASPGAAHGTIVMTIRLTAVPG